jgi:cytochrome c-type biogenesis protein CcmH/NrfG
LSFLQTSCLVEEAYALKLVCSSPALRRALACYRRALVIDPQHVASLVSAADILFMSSDLEASRGAAADLYRRALALQPRQATALRYTAARGCCTIPKASV